MSDIHVKIEEKEKEALVSYAKRELGYQDFSKYIKDSPTLIGNSRFARKLDDFFNLSKSESDKLFPIRKWKIIYYLYAHKDWGGMTQTDIASYMDKTSPTITLDLEELYQKNIVELHARQAVTYYELTVEGLVLGEQIFYAFYRLNVDQPKKYPASTKTADEWALEVANELYGSGWLQLDRYNEMEE